LALYSNSLAGAPANPLKLPHIQAPWLRLVESNRIAFYLYKKNYQSVDGAVLINRGVIWTNWLASLHILKMAGRSFGRKKYYGLTVTVSSKEWWMVKRSFWLVRHQFLAACSQSLLEETPKKKPPM
jgi:hypothetical protein